VVAGTASGAAGGVADSVTAGVSVAASFFWHAVTFNRSPNTTTTNKTHKEPFFIVIISYPFFFCRFYSAGGVTPYFLNHLYSP
jgi:hypothetical protein